MPPSASENQFVKDKELQRIRLNDLLLDEHNPRFAEHINPGSTQRDILNLIVRQFGVDDVLSSIAVSGYFSAEPLVCKESEDGKYIVVEGNRRLAAMLILSGDERAVDHSKRAGKYQELHREHGSPSFNPVPSIVFRKEEGNKALLSYLGVRHIVSTKEWDSYAKATWISHALETAELSLDDIAEMIGDSRGTIQRLLSGYHFVAQLERKGQFNPENSVKKGRGSNTQYPFSWVYTLLGYNSVRDFVSLSADPSSKEPVPDDKIDKAGLVMQAMFGDTSRSLNPAITDSRELGALARIVADPEKVVYLKDGKSVEEIERLTQPLEDLLHTSMVRVLDSLREINGRLNDEDLEQDAALQLVKIARMIKKQADSLAQSITDSSAGNN